MASLEQIKVKYHYDLYDMIEDEAEHVLKQHERQREYGRRKMQWGTAKEIATERVHNWILTAHEEEEYLNDPSRMIRFVASCRRAKVWATLVGLAKED